MLGIKDMSTASGEKKYFPYTHEEKSTVHKSTEVSLLNDSNVLEYTLLYSKWHTVIIEVKQYKEQYTGILL